VVAAAVRAHVLTDPTEVAEAAARWDALPGSTGPVGGSAWVRAWLATYSDRYRLAAVVAARAGEPTAALPLVRWRRRPWFLETMGVRELLEPTDARGADPAALRAVAGELARLRLPLRLKRLPADSPLLPVLRTAFGRRALVLSRGVTGTPTIALDDTWRAPESHFSSRRRQDFRAARRRADKLGEVHLTVEEPATAEDADRLFDEFVAIEAAGWKTEAGTSLAAQPRLQACYRTFSRLAAEEKSVRFAVLRIAGRPVAMQLGSEYGGQYCVFKIGFDEEFARCSPGTLLMLHTVAWAAERGLRSVELLGVEEPWTALWSTGVRPCVEVHAYPLSLWSLPAAAAVAAELTPRVLRAATARLRRRRDEK
jgi:CelD/BcsL family acetyltransferase involved in cellulose biosynthesis